MRWALLWIPLLAWSEDRFVSREWQSVAGAQTETPVAFRAVGLYCPDHTRVRASADGLAWSEWLETGHADDSGTLVFFGASQRFLEASESCRILLIDAGESAPRRANLRQAATALDVVKRADWGCTPERCPVREAPIYTTVTHLVVHHSAGANTASDWAAVVRSIWVLHVQGNGWNDIGYNYLVDPNGVLYEGRAGGDGVLGAHFSAVNGGTMGVCLMGTFSRIAPPQASVDTLRRLLYAQALRWKIDPGGRSLHAASRLMLNNISGHRDAGLSPQASGTTECPGNGVYALLAGLRQELRTLVEEQCLLTLTRPFACFAGDGGTLELGASIASGCPVTVKSNSDWMEVNETTLTLGANPASGARSGTLSVNGQLMAVTQAGNGKPFPPCVSFRGVVSAAGFDGRPVAPGSLVSILGEGLAAGEASTEPGAWQTSLGGVTVQVNGRPARLGYVSATQINVLLPDNLPIGSARVVVTSAGEAGPERLFWVSEAVPAIFQTEGPVSSGDVMKVYLTGAGAANLPWTVSLGQGLSLEAIAGLPGLQLALVQLPGNLAAGAYEFTITVAGATSLPAQVQVN